MFDTKIAIVVRNDLAGWQKLNVTAFLSGGIVGANAEIVGELYEDAAGNTYHPLVVQPMIILAADAKTLRKVYRRAMDHGARLALYIQEMFETGHDAANREAVRRCAQEDLDIVGLALREEKRAVDRITRGAKMHP